MIVVSLGELDGNCKKEGLRSQLILTNVTFVYDPSIDRPKKTVADAKQKHYFQILTDYGGIWTIFAHQPFSLLRQTMRQCYYQYGTLNCSIFDPTNQYDQLYSNKICQTEYVSACDDGPLTLDHFKPGLPPDHKITASNVPLTFIGVLQNAVVHEEGDVYHQSLHIHSQRCTRWTIFQPGKDRIFEEVFTITQFWSYGFNISPWKTCPVWLHMLTFSPTTQKSVYMCLKRTHL